MSNNSSLLPFDTSHAFIIGINEYTQVSKLDTAKNDALYLAEILGKNHNYYVHPPLIDATGNNIRNLLEEISSQVRENDRVLFYFAGHGIALDSDKGAQGFIVPADASPGNRDTLISMDTLYKSFENLNCRHFFLILDCCFSGAFKWTTGKRDIVFDIPNKIYQERFNRYIQDPAWQVLTSSAHDQKAVDVLADSALGKRGTNQGNHSPFASALFDALEGKGDVIPPDGGDGVITVTELYLYLRDEVEVNTLQEDERLRQTPSIFPLPKHDKGEYIFLTPNHPLNLPPTPKQNPYKGLKAYNEEDKELFYGREQVINDLSEHVKKHDFVVLSGISGAGKSSIVKAGLLPQLREKGYEVLEVIRPGREPRQVIDATENKINQFKKDIKFVLVCDQYEELITQTEQETEKEYFVEKLAYFLKTYKIKIIITVRSDFEPQFEKLILTDYWKAGRFVVPPFSSEDLRELIVKPALQEVLYFEPPELVNEIINEVVQSPGALPLLSFTLSELYEMYIKSARTDRSLHIDDYKELGGVIGALRTRADALYDSLSENEQDTMRKIMIRMVSIEGGELAGKRVYSDDLHYTSEKENNRVNQVLDKLLKARLIVRGSDNQLQEYNEPAHDALVRAWSRLWEWVKNIGEDTIILQNRLHEAVKEHSVITLSEKYNPLLWDTDPRLNQLELIKQSNNNWLNKKESSFIEASVHQRDIKKKRQQRNLVLVIVSLLSLTIASVWFGIQSNINAELAELKTQEALDSADVAQQQRQIAQDSTLSAQQQRDRANQKTLEARDSAQVAQQQRQIAQDSTLSAQQQRDIANQKTQEARDSAVVAQKQRQIARDSTIAAQKQRDRATKSENETKRINRVIEAENEALISIQKIDTNLAVNAYYKYDTSFYRSEINEVNRGQSIFEALYKTKGRDVVADSREHKFEYKSIFENQESILYCAGLQLLNNKVVVSYSELKNVKDDLVLSNTNAIENIKPDANFVSIIDTKHLVLGDNTNIVSIWDYTSATPKKFVSQKSDKRVLRALSYGDNIYLLTPNSIMRIESYNDKTIIPYDRKQDNFVDFIASDNTPLYLITSKKKLLTYSVNQQIDSIFSLKVEPTKINFGRDNNELLIGGEDGSLTQLTLSHFGKTWYIDSKSLTSNNPTRIESIITSKDKKFIITSHANNSIYIYNTKYIDFLDYTPFEINNIDVPNSPKTKIRSLQVTSDNYLLVGLENKELLVYDLLMKRMAEDIQKETAKASIPQDLNNNK